MSESAFETYTFEIMGISPLINSKPFVSERSSNESAPAFEERCWSERMHVDDNGNLFRPSRELHMTLFLGAKNDGEKIKGKNATTYASRVGTSTMSSDMELWLPADKGGKTVLSRRLTKDDAVKRSFFVPADGKSGSGVRVTRFFPELPTWAGRFDVTIFDHNLLEDIERVLRFLRKAGIAAGVGAWRPANRGTYGRFTVLGYSKKSAQ